VSFTFSLIQTKKSKGTLGKKKHLWKKNVFFFFPPVTNFAFTNEKKKKEKTL